MLPVFGLEVLVARDPGGLEAVDVVALAQQGAAAGIAGGGAAGGNGPGIGIALGEIFLLERGLGGGATRHDARQDGEQRYRGTADETGHESGPAGGGTALQAAGPPSREGH